MNDDTIRAMQQRVRRYWLEDGLPELGMGVLFLYIGGFMALPVAVRHSAVGRALSLLWIVLGLGSFTLLKWIKGRTTFPRTGYAAPSRLPRGGDWAIVLLVAAMVAIPGWLASRLGGTRWEAVEPLLTPLALAIGMAVLAARLGVGRLALVGVLGLLGAGASFLLGARGEMLIAAYCAVLGCALVASGALTFAAYRRRSPVPSED